MGARKIFYNLYFMEHVICHQRHLFSVFFSVFFSPHLNLILLHEKFWRVGECIIFWQVTRLFILKFALEKELKPYSKYFFFFLHGEIGEKSLNMKMFSSAGETF